MRRNLKTAIVVAFLACLLVLFIRPTYRQAGPSLSGTREKDFPFTVDGKAGRLSDLRGRVVVLNFWGSWCPPCIEETPSLNALQQWLGPKGGTVLGMAEPQSPVEDESAVHDDLSAYAKFLKDYRVGFPTDFDSGSKAADSYGTHQYPETYIIDRNGVLQRKLIGAQDWTSPLMTQYLTTLLNDRT